MITVTVIGSSSAGNAYMLDNGHSRLLLECGVRWKEIQQALNYKTASLDGVLITHEHGDHAGHIKHAIKAGLDIYLSQGTAEAINVTGHQIHHVKSLQQFKVQNWTILPFDTVHDAAEPLGFLIQSGADKLLFLTDTSYCKYLFKGITHLMIECNFDDEILQANIESGRVEGSRRKRLINSHMSLTRVKDFLKNNDLRSLQLIWLIHLSNDNSDEQKFKDEIQAATGIPVVVC